MTDQPAPAPADPGPPADRARPGFWQRRRDRYVAEIQRNRQGGHRIPTWVLAVGLMAMVAIWAAIILLS